MKFVLNKPDSYAYSVDPRSDNGCLLPFKRIEIQGTGDISICCPSWLPEYCGNILTSTPEELLKNVNRTAILNDMAVGKFTYCNDTCPHLNFYLTTGKVERAGISIVPINTLLSVLGKNRFVIGFSYDRSCNLQCPSCRKELIINKLDNSTQSVNISAIHLKVKELIDYLMLRGDKIRLVLTGSGDPFASPLYWSYLIELSKMSLPSDFEISLMTNGVLMTESTWAEIQPLWKHIHFVDVSIDAAKEDTYNIVRKNGNFSRLKKNLTLFDQMVAERKFPNLFSWQTSMVVQSANYRELKEYAEWQLTYSSLKNISINRILHWGHLTNDEYKRLDIIDLAELTKILSNPVFKHPYIKLGNLSGFVNR
jgi:wyosine [tRNA(Phe)-imidazoG37] synthetase (radical SAM superfamily)